MTKEEIEMLERLEREATAGPWKACGCGRCGLVWSKLADDTVASATSRGVPRHPDGTPVVCAHGTPNDSSFTNEEMSRNAEVIAALRNAAPHLIACAKFVEEHGSAVEYALASLAKMPSSFSYYAEHAAAYDAIQELRRSEGEGKL